MVPSTMLSIQSNSPKTGWLNPRASEHFLRIEKFLSSCCLSLPDGVMQLFPKMHLPQSFGSCLSYFLTPVTPHQLDQLMFHIL